MGAVRLDRKTFFYYVLFFTFFILNLFSYVLNFPFKMLPRGFSSLVTMPFRKVLYCIALLLIGWSSAQAKKLDVSKLDQECSRRNIAYVKEQVAEFGNKTVVEAKEKYGPYCCDIHGDSYYSYGESCLMVAVGPYRYGQADEETLELVKYLLGIGADVDEKCRDGGYTAIAVATQNRDIPLMKLLLKYKADTEIADQTKRGETPIFHAIRKSEYDTDGSEALSLLIEKGANINATDKYGQTALDLATKKRRQTSNGVASGRREKTTWALRLLMKKGANIDAKDKNGKTALRVAMCKKEFQW